MVVSWEVNFAIYISRNSDSYSLEYFLTIAASVKSQNLQLARMRKRKTDYTDFINTRILDEILQTVAQTLT